MALRNHRLAALALFTLLAVAHTWPLASDLAGLARLDNDDEALNTWAIAWVAHILPRHPLQLFEAPIFYPEHHTLAYSEHLLVPALMGAPLLWLGVSPVIVHNVLIIAGLALSGFVMALVMARWTGQIAAGVLAGLIYAFNAHVLTRFPHLQAQHVEFFPLVLYFLDRVIARSRDHDIRSPDHPIIRSPDVWLLTASVVLQGLCSNYLLVFTAFAVMTAAAARADEWLPRPRARLGLLIAGAARAAALAPFLWPYYEVSRDQGLSRSIEEVARYSADWRDYLVTGGRLHYALWSHAFFDGRTALFPGITAVVLAGVAVHARMAWRDRRARMASAVAVTGLLLSFGPTLPGYALLHAYVPLVGGLRNAARWGWLALAGASILAGFGAAHLLARQARDGRRRLILAVLCGLITVESLRAPVGFTPFEGIPRIYDRLIAEERLVVAEFPFYAGDAISRNGPYVLANSRYLKPLVNGYSGFQPATYQERAKAITTFPSHLAIAQLQALGVTHVLVHAEAFRRRHGAGALAAIDLTTELERLADENDIRLYRLR